MLQEFFDFSVNGEPENLVEAIGLEPTTLCLQSRCSPN
jgi:hypothetical protein